MVFATYWSAQRSKSRIFVVGDLEFAICHAIGVNWGRLDLTGGVNAYVSMQAHRDESLERYS